MKIVLKSSYLWQNIPSIHTQITFIYNTETQRITDNKIIASQYFMHINSVKTSSTLSSPTTQPKQSQLRKSKSKFARTQESQKLDKKKLQLKSKEEEKICFISSYKLKVHSQMARETLSGFNTQNLCKPQLFHQESIIQPYRCDNDEVIKMNDSLFSIYDELANQAQRKKEADMLILRKQLQNLKIIIEEQRLQKKRALEQLQDLDYLQHFLMERQTYICSITQKNILLNQKLSKTEQQKESIRKELVYIRNTYELNLKRYQQQIAEWKNKCKSFVQEKKTLQQSNNQLRMQIQQFFMQNNQSTAVMQSFMTENQEKKQENQSLLFKGYYQQKMAQSVHKDTKFLLNPMDFSPEKHPLKYSLTYRELHPSRFMRADLEKSINDSKDKTLPQCKKECNCHSIIKKLNQKLRYNQIQIDILKKMKGKGEEVQSDNQSLKRQIKNLTQKIEHLGHQKKQQNRKFSESPLDLLLASNKESQGLL